MKKTIYYIAVLLLLFNGAGALFGGWSLMTDPSGEQLGLPLSALEHSPFQNFFLPGLVLFFSLGLFSLVAIIAMLFSFYHAPFFVLAEGCLLTGWLIFQLIWTQLFHPWQAIMAAIGLLLMVCGWKLLWASKTFLHRKT